VFVRTRGDDSATWLSRGDESLAPGDATPAWSHRAAESVMDDIASTIVMAPTMPSVTNATDSPLGRSDQFRMHLVLMVHFSASSSCATYAPLSTETKRVCDELLKFRDQLLAGCDGKA